MARVRKPTDCIGCVGHHWSHYFSNLEGDGSGGLMVIAEALGRNEERDGLPLRKDAKAGGVFQLACDKSALHRETMTLTNIVRCRPPNNELKGMSYEREAIDHCRQYLDQAIAARQPRLILALGDVPLRELSMVGGSISDLRGFVLQSRYGIPMIATYHPSHLARGAMHLFGAFRHDLRRAEKYARTGVPAKLPTHYQLNPTVESVTALYHLFRSDPTLAIPYDVETDELLGGKTGRIIQIQFSPGPGQAVVVPWTDRFIDLIKRIFLLPNDKWDWNGRLFDRIKLREHGIELVGEFHDLMNAWAHLQPNFMSGKDEHEDEKKVPTKLMRLQACMSFYFPNFGPWKAAYRPEWDWRWDGQLLPLPVRLYGAKDVDATRRLGHRLFADLRKQGLYGGYYRFKHELSYVLDDLGARGLPVDREEQARVREHIESEEVRLLEDLQALIPDELRSVHPKHGYKKVPKIVTQYADEFRGVLDFHDALRHDHSLQRRCFELPQAEREKLAAKHNQPPDDFFYEERWCRLEPFNPNSGQQLLRYIEYKGYEVPKHIDTGRPTTGKEEILKLIEQTDDEVLKLSQKLRKLTKLRGTYCSGDWVPGDDGRVHGEFRFGTASGQTSCSSPNIQQFPEHFNKDDEWLAEIGARIKACVRAEPGHKLVKVDLRGFHARMQGWLAEDENYYRLASLDLHSFNTGQFMEVVDKDELLALDDEALLKRLHEIKKQYSHERNALVKRISFLNQYGGGADKASRILGIAVPTVMQVLESIAAPFPKTFEDFPAQVEREMAKTSRLVSAFGCIRWFWDLDAKQAIAFSVSNPAHCHIQDAGIRLWQQGAFEKYECVNFAHDSWWWHPKEELVDECIAAARAEMERPSSVLVNSLGAFHVAADAQVGDRLSEMQDVK